MSDDIDYDPKYAGCEHPDSYALVDTLEELEALRAELTEQARLVGMGAERELKLIAERDEARGEVAAIVAWIRKRGAEWATPLYELYDLANECREIVSAIEARAYVKENDGD